MENTLKRNSNSRLPVLRSGDPNTAFQRMSAAEILRKYGRPRSLLSSSFKSEKCLSVEVLARVLFFTPGVFCTHATSGCLAACLGHSSGRMVMPTHAIARDRRTALYLEDPELFLKVLDVELALLEEDAARLGFRAAGRLNGSSDLPWESRHPDIFRRFPRIRFFDYTKVPQRMDDFLDRSDWPGNYHLTFSAQPSNHEQCRRILERGGTVAVVFWPETPRSFWGFPVLNGDEHDARFLDPMGSIVGLTAKGLARMDRSGFTIRPCPQCGPSAPELELQLPATDRHEVMVHQWRQCGFSLRQATPALAATGAHSLAA